jgi:RNA polymerase sigma-70 factor (ECF subfamily)
VVSGTVEVRTACGRKLALPSVPGRVEGRPEREVSDCQDSRRWSGLSAITSIGRARSVERREFIAEGEALQDLYERHAPRIFRFCLCQLRERHEAEDAAQTTFLHALGALRRGVVPVAESAWLLKIARNVCLSRFDAARRRDKIEFARDPHVLAESAPAYEADDGDLLRLREALAELPERQRQAIILREWRGLSYAEISDELGLSRSAVEALLFRARRTLARNLGGGRGLRGLDLAGLLGALRSLLEGSAAKLAVGALAIAAAGPFAAGPLEHRSRPIALPPIPADRQTRETVVPARSSKTAETPLARGRASHPGAAAKPTTRRAAVRAPVRPAHHHPPGVTTRPSVDDRPSPSPPAGAEPDGNHPSLTSAAALPAVALTLPSLPTPPAFSLPSLPPVPPASELPQPPPLPQVQNPLPATGLPHLP